MKRRPTPKQQGEVAELAFMHKVATLGFGVAKPYGDSRPYDFIVDVNGRLRKVQVKSTYGQFQGGYFVNAQRRLRWGTCPYKESEVELLVAYVAPEDCWYVIPIGVIAPRKSLRLYPHRPEKDGRYGRFHEAWGLMEGASCD